MELKIKDKTYVIEELKVKNSQVVLEKASKLISNIAANKVITEFAKTIDKNMEMKDFVVVGTKVLPVLLNIAFDDTIELIAATSNIPKKELEDMGITKLFKILEAIVKENDVQELMENLKNSVGAIKERIPMKQVVEQNQK
jgi:hypothetical protein